MAKKKMRKTSAGLLTGWLVGWMDGWIDEYVAMNGKHKTSKISQISTIQPPTPPSLRPPSNVLVLIYSKVIITNYCHNNLHVPYRKEG